MPEQCKIPDNNWPNVMAKFRAEARKYLSSSGKRDGVVIITSTMFLDSEGEPLLWWIKESARVEPSKVARKTLIRVLGGAERDT